MRLVSFDYLRGIAILFIVASHAYGAWQIDTLIEKVIANIISGGTVLFVFISGFFFHHIFYHNFNLSRFLRKKAQNVLIPYMILSSLGFAYFALSSEAFPFSWELVDGSISSWQQHLELYLNYLWSGRIMWAYWYIPFIMIMFVLSPLFIRYIELSKAVRLVIMLLLFVISAQFIHRPILGLSPIHSVLYFVPVYLFGINYSIHHDAMNRFLQNKIAVLGSIVIMLALMQSLYFNAMGSSYKSALFSYATFDINLLQKLVLCLFFIALLNRYQHKTIPGLKLLASSSFAIYFLHTWVLHITDQLAIYSRLSFIPQPIVWLGITATVILICLAIASAIKHLLKQHSRFVIGW